MNEFQEVTKTGAIGRPDLASAAKGKEFLDGIVREVITFVDDFAKRIQVVLLQLGLQPAGQPGHLDHRVLFRLLAGDGVLLSLQQRRRAAVRPGPRCKRRCSYPLRFRKKKKRSSGS